MFYSDHKRETHHSGHVFHVDWNIFVDSVASKRWKRKGATIIFFYVNN